MVQINLHGGSPDKKEESKTVSPTRNKSTSVERGGGNTSPSKKSKKKNEKEEQEAAERAEREERERVEKLIKKFGRKFVWEGYFNQEQEEKWVKASEMFKHINEHVQQDLEDYILLRGFKAGTH